MLINKKNSEMGIEHNKMCLLIYEKLSYLSVLYNQRYAAVRMKDYITSPIKVINFQISVLAR